MPVFSALFAVVVTWALTLVAALSFFDPPAIEPAWPDAVPGYAYAPQRAGQSALTQSPIDSRDIASDLALLSGHTKLVRSYTVEGPLADLPRMAQSHDLKVALGAWLGPDAQRNQAEMDRLIQSQAGAPDAVERIIVGNETLLRQDLSVDELIAHLDRARAAMRQPVSTAEPWHVWLSYPQLADHTDYVAVHLLPYWEGVAVDDAVDHVFNLLHRLKQAFPDKPVVVTEVGWPSQGRDIHQAKATPANQARFLRRFAQRAAAEQLPFYVMEAFDQRWKARLEGSVGSYWGVFTEDRQLKWQPGSAIRDFPQSTWAVWAAALLAVFVGRLLLADSQGLQWRGRLFLVLCTVGVTWVWVIYAIGQWALYHTLVSSLVAAILALGILGMSVVFLVEAHEWAEAQFKPRTADLPGAADVAPGPWPFVSIHVPIHAEPPAMVMQTLDHLAALNYPAFEVIVVDNNTTDPACWKPVQQHCASLGSRFRFHHREGLTGYKAGALNVALTHTDPQASLIAVVDADYQVSPDWLRQLAPHFDRPEVVLVQAPQDYRDGADNRFKALCESEYRGFFHIGMVTRQARNAIIQHGTMTLVRKQTLLDLGGWDTRTVTEDAELGLRLMAAGGQALYQPASWGRGLTPDQFSDYKTQRYRWVYGAMQILRQQADTLLGRRGSLTPGQRFHFIAGWLPWLSDGLNLVFTGLLALWALLLCFEPTRLDAPPLVVSLLPMAFLLFRIAKQIVLYRRRLHTSWRVAFDSVAAGLSLSYTVGRAVLAGLFQGRDIAFVRTPKQVDTQRSPVVSDPAAHESWIAVLLVGLAIALLFVLNLGSRENQAFCALLVLQSLPFWAAVFMGRVSQNVAAASARQAGDEDRVRQLTQARGWQVLVCTLAINALLGFEAVWPTLWVLPQARLAPEWVLVLLGLSACLALGLRIHRAVVSAVAVLLCCLILGRYLEVVVPNLLGRQVNLYWDLPQLPRFLWVTLTGSPVWLSVPGVLLVLLAVRQFYRLVRGLLQVVVQGAAPVVRRVWLWGVLLPLATLACTHYTEEDPQVAYLSKAIAPTYWREATRMWDALFPERVARLLPASTVIDDALSRPAEALVPVLRQRDVTFMFLETYGAVLYDLPEAQAATRRSRQALEAAIAASGRHVVSAFYRSPTIGGASDLAHMSVLSGIDLSDARKHDILLTTRRPTLLTVFQRAGYEVLGLYHSVGWDWPERAYYGFDRYLSGPDLQYGGPSFGFWKIPDQYAAARVEQLLPRTPDVPPRFTLFATISTHFPFNQVPPYQADWNRLLGPTPFDAADVARSQSEAVNWLNMRPDYFRTIQYAHTWLAGYFSQPEPRESVYILVGDHQPTGSVTGKNPSWDVPVFIIARDQATLDRFRSLGFHDGMASRQRALGGLHDLTTHVLQALGPSALSSSSTP